MSHRPDTAIALDPRGLLIGWKIASPNASLASVRYRAILPLLALQEAGIGHRLITEPMPAVLNGLAMLVIVKSFTPDDIHLAEQAAARGIPVVFDLCDNVFIESYRGGAGSSPAAILQTMLPYLSMLVVTTEPLAEAVRATLGDSVPLRVIPDGLESLDLFHRAAAVIAPLKRSQCSRWLMSAARYARTLPQRQLRLKTLRSLIARAARQLRSMLHWRFWAKRAYRIFDNLRRRVNQRDSKTAAPTPAPRARHTVLWFGNHGAPHARFGMLDLLDVRQDLERVAKDFSIELLVISNHRDKFDKHIAPFNLPTRYIEWSAGAVEEALRTAALVLVPNSNDPFSVCKSANRSVLALSRGVPVVATPTPALDGLADCIECKGFESGMRRYLSSPADRAAHLATAAVRIEALFGARAIAQAWTQVIQHATGPMGVLCEAPPPQLVFVLNLIQDLDLALPLIEASQSRHIPLEVWAGMSLLAKSPRVAKQLSKLGARVRPVPDGDHPAFPKTARALVTIAETNLGPHRLARQLCERANQCGLFTATLQHGYENVGLTYEDDVHPISEVNLASRRIYVWGPLALLHPGISAETRRKCVPLGCPKPAANPAANLDRLLPEGVPVIGIFENLHWHRYSDAYRAFFIDGVCRAAQAFPDIVFLLKPHHAGLWLTRRRKGELSLSENVVIADPQHPDWESHTTPSLLGRLAAVITTPSTVALDAARHGVPVIVVRHTLALEQYAPLGMIESELDWSERVRDAIDQPEALIARGQRFVDRVLVTKESAAIEIIDDLMDQATKVESACPNVLATTAA